MQGWITVADVDISGGAPDLHGESSSAK